MCGVRLLLDQPEIEQFIRKGLDVLSGDVASPCDRGHRVRAMSVEELQDRSLRYGHRTVGVEILGKRDEQVVEEPDLVEEPDDCFEPT